VPDRQDNRVRRHLGVPRFDQFSEQHAAQHPVEPARIVHGRAEHVPAEGRGERQVGEVA
jgi:hypothetical protein